MITTPDILYLQHNVEHVPASLIDYLSSMNICNIKACSTISTLATKLELNPKLILVDSEYFTCCYEKLEIFDIINMITTICMMSSTKLVPIIGVIINKTNTKPFVSAIKKTEISGIVPSAADFTGRATVEAISSLLNNVNYWPKHIIDNIAGSTVEKDKPAGLIVNSLTPRQQQVLSLIQHRGLSNKAIASTLKIAESTVKIHVSKLMDVFGVRNRAQLILAATDGLSAG